MCYFEKKLRAISKRKTVLTLVFLIFTFTKCTPSSYTEGTFYKLMSQPLSLNNNNLKTCVFDINYRITHFPMSHTPPVGHYTPEIYEEVSLSQFQLLHTIIDYHRSHWDLAVFDENITSDNYNESYFKQLASGTSSDSYSKLNGQVFHLNERMNTAQRLFSNSIPRYYEHLSVAQKSFLFHTGASLTLYLLGQIPKIHKVISSEKLSLLKAHLQDAHGNLQLEGNDYWLFDFREEELRKEVLLYLQQNNNPRKMVLIAYGSSHDFSDEFLGHSFQSGHSFCLKWRVDLQLIQPLP